MKVLHLLAGGDVGGIETLMRDYAKYSKHENHFIMLWGRDGKATTVIRAEGCPVVELQLKKGQELKGFRYIRKYCIKNHLDAVIAHHAAPLAHLYLLGLKYLMKNIKTIAYAHGAAEDMFRINDKKGLWLRKKILTLSLKRADAVVAISNFVGKSLIDCFDTPVGKIHVIYNGTPLPEYQAPKVDKKRGKFKIVYVGRLIKEKGVQLTLEALSKLKTDKEWSFYVIGDGPYRKQLEETSKNLGIDEKVIFMGSRSDVPQQLEEADIFIHFPVWREGFGITIIEAMAAGLVCICGNVGAIPEIITDGDNGYLIEYLNRDVLADVLADVLDKYDTSEMGRIRKNAVERAKQFSIESYTEKFEKVVGYYTIR